MRLAATINITMLPPSSLHEKLGIETTRASATEVIDFMPATGNTQPVGLLYGEVTAVLVEGLASLATWLYAQPERVAVGVDPNLIHLCPVVSDRVIGRVVPVHLGNGTTVHTVRVHDEEGRLTAVGRLISRLVVPRE